MSTIITHNGQSMSLSAWAAEIGIHVNSLKGRLKRMTIEKALTMPRQRINARVVEPGALFGQYTVIGEIQSDDKHHRYFECICACGQINIVRADNLLSNTSTSCVKCRKRSKSFWIEGADGDCYKLAYLSRMVGISQSTIRYRIKSGWTLQQALSLPVRGK